MNFVLVLRAEIVCLIILLYLSQVSRTYRMGKDGLIFNQILLSAVVHVALDIVTVWTVNHLDTVPLFWNNLAHILFYLSAILYAYALCLYVLNLSRPQHMDRKKRLLALAPVLVYLVLVLASVLPIEYMRGEGTNYSGGPATTVGFGIAFVYFAIALASIFVRWNKVGKHFKLTMLPMLLLLIGVELVQTQVKELLFTGCAITISTVAFFFTLENPAAVLERKVMMDALSGLGTRSGYENDMKEYDRMFEEDKDLRFTFLFVDINNLKSVNGMYGHQEGDRYINNMAVLLVTNLQEAEHIYRMGGDEFLAIYRKTEEKDVIRDIQRVQKACEKPNEYGYVPELAIGYAISDPQYNTLRDVLRVADYMMYRNKADLKREIAEGVLHHGSGTRLNLTGLTDRLFDAMCITSEQYYPFLTNLETYVTRVAPAMVEFFGLEGEFISDFNAAWSALVHPDDLQEYTDDVTATLNGRKQYHFCRYRAKAKNGEYVEVTCRGGIYHGRDGEPDVFAGYMVNHGAVDQLDHATGLRTHHVMYDKLKEALEQGTPAVVARLALRNMTRMRMLYGGQVCDSALRSLADELVQAVDDSGEVFSNRGTDFMIYLPHADAGRANALYRQIRRKCANGILTGDQLIPVDISGGAVLLPNETVKTPQAIRQATLFALEEADAAGRNNLAFFQAQGTEDGTDEKEMLRTIHHDCVTERKNFFLRYQPIIRAKDGSAAGAEALLRWKSDKYGEVAPGRFITFLENDPAYEQLGYEIIRRTAAAAARFRQKLPDFRINVNITALQLLEEDFIPNVLSILEEEKLAPAGLILELTERCKEMEIDLLRDRVTELKKTGILVALDDMGTGYSTVDLLLHMPADEIKLDMLFTQEIMGDDKHEVLTEALCTLAAKRNADICFEGIETRELRDFIKGYGDVLMQGYFFDKPLLDEEFWKKYCENDA